MAKLIFATNNPGKLLEVSKLGNAFGIEVISPKQLGLSSDVEEDGNSYQENSKIKMASILEQITDPDIWVAGDDSGVSIDALNGEPNIHTRRWLGYEMTDQEIIDYALLRLKDVPYEKRTAHFISTVALGKKNVPVQWFEGRIDGLILDHADVNTPPHEGFPFRSLFYIPEKSKMLGDVEETDKEFITHRQKAFTKVFEYINKSLS